MFRTMSHHTPSALCLGWHRYGRPVMATHQSTQTTTTKAPWRQKRCRYTMACKSYSVHCYMQEVNHGAIRNVVQTDVGAAQAYLKGVAIEAQI